MAILRRYFLLPAVVLGVCPVQIAHANLLTPLTQIPEPSTVLFLGLGLCAIALIRLIRKR